jgi:hypothetical protein
LTVGELRTVLRIYDVSPPEVAEEEEEEEEEEVIIWENLCTFTPGRKDAWSSNTLDEGSQNNLL